jgi:hypothetical protein
VTSQGSTNLVFTILGFHAIIVIGFHHHCWWSSYHFGINDASQGAGHANHTRGNGAEFAQDLLSLPSGPITSGAEFGQDPLSLHSGPITRLRAKLFKEALNGLIQENGVDSKKTKMGPNNDQGLVHVIKAIDEVN